MNKLDEQKSDEGRFSRHIVDALCKRAANRCSNPECNAITSGPAQDENKAVILGEAAHIYGANRGSARFDITMLQVERASITNGIWLCRNCHKLIDADSDRFPAAMLFKWRAIHEKNVINQLGKTNDALRRQLIEAEVEHLGDVGHIAQQILIDKPFGWELLLSAEILRYKCHKTIKRWEALKKGLYAKPLTRIGSDSAILWISDRLSELPGYIQAATLICNSELKSAWGPPGTPGSVEAISEVCCLFAETCENLLFWEETIRFTKLPTEFDEIAELLRGVGGRALEQITVLREEMSKILPEPGHSQTYEITINVDLPSNWQNEIETALQKLTINLYVAQI